MIRALDSEFPATVYILANYYTTELLFSSYLSSSQA